MADDPQLDTLRAIDLSKEEGIILPSQKHDDNTAGVGFTADKQDGAAVSGFWTRTLGKFGTAEVEAGASSKKGGFIRAFLRKKLGK